MRGRLGGVAALLLAAAVITMQESPAIAAPRSDARWTATSITVLGGTATVHADVLRPANLDPSVKTPVVVSVGPYFNYSGQTEVAFRPTRQAPSLRFYDFLDLSKLLERGYTYVMVDLPGFGGSGGCTDWGGPTEQGVTHDAVEWAATQPWSDGKVALFGKSYDALTGLMGAASEPKGLAAVVAMEPVFATYRYLYSNGVRFPNSVLTPLAYQRIQAMPGSVSSPPDYLLDSLPRPDCDLPVLLGQQGDDPTTPFWVARDLSHTAAGSRIPVFLTQGFLENNTKPDGMFDFFNSLKGPNRAWFGQFAHVRGWERTTDGEARLQTGHDGFVAEVMRFLDLHLKGIQPAVVDPPIVVQDINGRYRAEAQWPPADMKMWWTNLRTGSYPDTGINNGVGNGVRGLWTVSQPLTHTVWLAGDPVVEFDVDAQPRANLVADLYDIADDGTATLMGRNAYLLRSGSAKGTLKLYGQDWPIAAGHRVGLLLTSSNSEWWWHVPTMSTVTVKSARRRHPRAHE